jgi:hypothetical protein
VRAYCESRLRAENDEQTTGSQTLVVAGDICAKPKPATSDELIAAMREYRKYKAWTVDAAKTADSRYHMACETQRGSDNSRWHAAKDKLEFLEGRLLRIDTKLRDIVSRFTEPPARNASRLEHAAHECAVVTHPDWQVLDVKGAGYTTMFAQLLEAICGDAGEWLEKANG